MKIEINSTLNESNPYYELWKCSLSNEDKIILSKTLGKEIQEELDKELLEKLKNDIPNIIAKEITNIQPCPDWKNNEFKTK